MIASTGVAGLLAVCVVVPAVAGAVPYAVVTRSMEPVLTPGTLAVVRPVADDEIAVGSVITYQVRSGEPEVVTHRVVEVAVGSGTPRFRTQGDANESPDPGWVRPVQVRGELWYAVPYAGRLAGVLTPEQRRGGVALVAVALAAYAVMLLLADVRGRRRSTLPGAGEVPAHG